MTGIAGGAGSERQGDENGVPTNMQLVLNGEDLQNMGLEQLGLVREVAIIGANPNDPSWALTEYGSEVMRGVHLFFSLSKDQRKILSLLKFGAVKYPGEEEGGGEQ